MEFKNSIKNAYSDINLHDCCFSGVKLGKDVIKILFDEGVGLNAEEQSEKAEVCINTMVEDTQFYISKHYRIIKGSKSIYVSKLESIATIEKFFKKGYLFEIVEEYYFNCRLLWRGEIFCRNKGKRKSKGYFEFMCYFENGLDLIYNFN